MNVSTTHNPLTLASDRVVGGPPEGATPAEVIRACNLVFTRPYFLLVNGEAVGRAEWGERRLAETDVLHFVELPRGGGNGQDSNPLQLVAMVAVMAFASWAGGALGGMLKFGAGVFKAIFTVGGMMLVNSFFASSAQASGQEIGSADPVYSITGGGNRARVGSPFVEQFGRLPAYPDLAMIPYVEYGSTLMAKNPQVLYFFGFVGVGEYDVEAVNIGDTPADDYDDVSYNILGPGESPTICTRIVWPCDTIAGQELTPDWMTTVLSARGTACTEIGIDIDFPAGLYGWARGDGVRTQAYAIYLAEARMIDGDGAALTDWEEILNVRQTSYSLQPLQVSHTVAAPFGSGRYEVRIRRWDEAGLTWGGVCDEMVNAVRVGQLRAYGPEHPDYGDVTILEMSVRASSQLTGAVADRINVIATRKLYPVEASGLGGTKAATKSIVDAAVYAVTAENAGKQDQSIVDFPSLYALKTILDGREDWFCWRFTSRTSVMEAAAVMGKCGRSIPYLPGGKFTMVRDAYQSLPAMVFSEDDYDEGSFELNHNFRTENDSTCVEMRYIDPDTWVEDSVYCYDEDGSEDNPAVYTLVGCADRDQAYREGMYMYLDDRYNRSDVSFSTGLKGHLPSPGARIVAPAPHAEWSVSGRIAAIDGTAIWLSEPVDFGTSKEGVLMVSDADGSMLGPYTVLPGDTAFVVAGGLPATVTTIQDDGDQAANFTFGRTVADIINMRLESIQPVGRNRIRLIGSVWHDDVYTEPGDAPVDAEDIPLLSGVLLQYAGVDESDHFVYWVAWSGSAEEVLVEIDEGSGYSTVQDNLDVHGLEVTTDAEDIAIRVTPYDGVTLETGDAIVEEYSVPATPTGFGYTEDAGVSVAFAWDAVTGAAGYVLQVIYDSETRIETAVAVASLTVTMTDLRLAGGPWASFDAAVWAVDADGNRGKAATAAVTMTVSYTLEAMTFLSGEYVQDLSGEIMYTEVPI